MSLNGFLKTRGIAQDTIDYFENEKIDAAAIMVMPSENLEKLVPKYGDRVALLDFCRKYNRQKRTSLFEKLKLRINQSNTQSEDAKFTNKLIKKRKLTRMIEIGWLNKNSSNSTYRQVRTKQGGGTRRIPVDKYISCQGLLQKAISLFFPDGISTLGDIKNFDVELLDWKSHKCDLSLTVERIYEISAMTTLRFYLATIQKTDIVELQNSHVSATITNGALLTEPTESSKNTPTRRSLRLANNSSELSTSEYFRNYLEEDNTHVSDINIPIIIEENFELPSLDLFPVLSESTVITQYEIVENKTTEKLILHRGRVFQEFVEAVKTHCPDFDSMTIEVILPNGKAEQGEDMGGVFKDVLSEFWQTFYETCTEGTSCKIPIIRHDFQENDWLAIAKILVNGYTKHGYFPIKIAKSFIMTCLGKGEDDQSVITDFLNFISPPDKELVERALSNYDDVDFNDILEFCDLYKSKWLPSKEKFYELIKQIAYQEIIQKPAFITKCFSLELQTISLTLDLEDLYKKLQPSVRNILASLETTRELSESDSKIYSFLTRYIKESEENIRGALLRFSTGLNLVCDKIKIVFIESNGFSRTPVGHICTNLLEVPNSYENYIEFRNEFNSLLASGIWVMDIV